MLNSGNVVRLVGAPGVAVAVDNVVVGTVTWAERTRFAPSHVVRGTSRVGLDLARIVGAHKARRTQSNRDGAGNGSIGYVQPKIHSMHMSAGW